MPAPLSREQVVQLVTVALTDKRIEIEDCIFERQGDVTTLTLKLKHEGKEDETDRRPGAESAS